MARDRQQYQSRLEQGLCPQCGKTRDDTRIICSTCRHAHNGNQIELRQRSNKVRAREQSTYYRNRAEVITAYGGKCVCCSEDYLPYLELDHINGAGAAHRKSLGLTGSSYFYWFKRNDYPPIVQVLCSNCHAAKTGRHECKDHSKDH